MPPYAIQCILEAEIDAEIPGSMSQKQSGAFRKHVAPFCTSQSRGYGRMRTIPNHAIRCEYRKMCTMQQEPIRWTAEAKHAQAFTADNRKSDAIIGSSNFTADKLRSRQTKAVRCLDRREIADLIKSGRPEPDPEESRFDQAKRSAASAEGCRRTRTTQSGAHRRKHKSHQLRRSVANDGRDHFRRKTEEISRRHTMQSDAYRKRSFSSAQYNPLYSGSSRCQTHNAIRCIAEDVRDAP